MLIDTALLQNTAREIVRFTTIYGLGQASGTIRTNLREALAANITEHLAQWEPRNASTYTSRRTGALEFDYRTQLHVADGSFRFTMMYSPQKFSGHQFTWEPRSLPPAGIAKIWDTITDLTTEMHADTPSYYHNGLDVCMQAWATTARADDLARMHMLANTDASEVSTLLKIWETTLSPELSAHMLHHL